MPKRKNYPGHIRKHGAGFQLILTAGGERHVYRFDVRKEAEEFASEESRRLQRHAAAGVPSGLRMSDLFDRYEESQLPQKAPNTARSYASDLKALRRYFVEERGDPKADSLRPLHVQELIDWRAHSLLRDGETVVSARTVAKTRVLLGIIYGWAESLELVHRNPVPAVAPPKHDPREPFILDADQFELLLAACEGRPMLATYVLTLWEAGLRCDSECLWLRWADIDLEGGFLTVHGARKGTRTKSGKARVVPLTVRLRSALQEHAAMYRMQVYKGQRSEWLFHHTTARADQHGGEESEARKRGARPAGSRINCLRHGFDKALERAGLPTEVRQHDLRHARVTRWLAEGNPIHLVRQAMGHSTVRVTEGYLHLVPQHLRQLVEEPEHDALRKLIVG